MLFPPIDPNERFRQRRAAARRRKRLRRGGLIGVSLGGVVLLGVGAQFVGRTPTPRSPTQVRPSTTVSTGPHALPVEIRGVHVSMALASVPGKLADYLD